MQVCISSGIRFKDDWPELLKLFSGLNCDFYLPEPKDTTGLSQQEVDRVMEMVNREFYQAIDLSEVLYVWCPEGYIGKGVAAEIGYAIAKEKDIISSSNIEDLGIWALVNKVMEPREFKEYLKEKYHV